jgi:hypothetical protein
MPGKSYLSKMGERKPFNWKLTSRAYDTLRKMHHAHLAEDAKSRALDTKWFNNGVQNIRIRNGETIPSGFKPGRLKLPSRGGVIAITDGISIRRIKEGGIIPEGWSRGFNQKTKDKMQLNRNLPSAEGRRWVNDGQVNRYLKKGEPVRDGWSLGRLKIGNFNPSSMRNGVKSRA